MDPMEYDVVEMIEEALEAFPWVRDDQPNAVGTAVRIIAEMHGLQEADCDILEMGAIEFIELHND